MKTLHLHAYHNYKRLNLSPLIPIILTSPWRLWYHWFCRQKNTLNVKEIENLTRNNIDHKHIYLFIICLQFLLNESHKLHLIIVHEQSPIIHIWWGWCYLMIFPNMSHVFVIQTHTYYEISPKKVVKGCTRLSL